MIRYRDELGKTYDAPDHAVEAFEQARRPLIIAGIVGQLVLLAGVLYIAWR